MSDESAVCRDEYGCTLYKVRYKFTYIQIFIILYSSEAASGRPSIKAAQTLTKGTSPAIGAKKRGPTAPLSKFKVVDVN
jgi:hypothetical protein